MKHLDECTQRANKWRVRALAFGRNLVPRIAALSGTGYPGCGFHYEKERRVRNICRILDRPFGVSRIGMVRYLIVKVGLERLAREVAQAEAYVRGRATC